MSKSGIVCGHVCAMLSIHHLMLRQMVGDVLPNLSQCEDAGR